jgi:hypothetical protein
MTAIISFLKDDSVFDPKDIQSMSMALEDICGALGIASDATAAREVIATRVIDLARSGDRSPTGLRDRVLREVPSSADRQNGGAQYTGL